MNKRHLDILVDIPYLWFADGYGQSTPIIANMLMRFADENNVSLGIKRTHFLAPRGQVDDERKKITKYFINTRDISSCSILFRYDYAKPERHGAKHVVTYTMFETDTAPEYWKYSLDNSSLVLVPSPYFVDVFKKRTTTEVDYLYIPIRKEYLEKYDDSVIVGSLPNKFVFSFAGTAGAGVDRKNLFGLVKEFSAFSWGDGTTLSLRSRGYKAIGNDRISVVQENKTLNNLVSFYCATHAGAYPSKGEGFGLPQFESALLGRPIVIADNTSMSWAKNIIKNSIPVPCVSGPAQYSERVPGEVGNWGFVDMNEFVLRMEELRDTWALDKDDYCGKMIENHNDDYLREEVSHEKIYSRLETHMKRLLEE